MDSWEHGSPEREDVKIKVENDILEEVDDDGGIEDILAEEE